MFLGANINNFLPARKDLPITPGTKMKQLQWDKLPQQQAQKTVFSDDPTQEEEWLRKLQLDGVWVEMEEDFKAKQLVVNLMGWCFPLSFLELHPNQRNTSSAETSRTQERAGSQH